MNKKERFEKVAVQRTNKIIKMLELLGNCSNKRNYEYSDEDVEKIFKTIEKELKDAKEQFKNDKKNRKKFTL
jgi:ABC-type Fe3+-hydroxamate transport system substrate-binding protein